MNTQLLIGGRLVTGEGAAEAVLDAASGAQIASIPAASIAQVEQAVQAAEAAFPGWAGTAPRERAAALLRNHGAVAVGRDLEEAIAAAELTERIARVHLLAATLGGARELAPDVVARERAMYRMTHGFRVE